MVSSICVLIWPTRPSIAFCSPAPSMIVVFSLLICTFLQVPKSSREVFSRECPTSSEITVAPVRMARSSNIAFLRSPNPGAFTADTFTIPLMLFTTKVARASPSTSSAIISNDLPAFATASKQGKRSLIFEIFLSWRRIRGSSSSEFIVSWLFMK